MHILIGLGIALTLLYFWLIGHWFARVIVFLLFSVIFFFMFAATARDTSNPSAGVSVGLLGIPLAWPLSGIPAYYWHRRAKTLLEEQNRYLRVG